MMDKEVVYIAELDADVDDVVAAHYLHNKGVLKLWCWTLIRKQKKVLREKNGLKVWA